MTGTTRLSAVQPTPVGVIRAVEERLDGLERELAAARDALAAAEAELIAAHRQSEVRPDALTTIKSRASSAYPAPRSPA
jgi:hypothetical protein